MKNKIILFKLLFVLFFCLPVIHAQKPVDRIFTKSTTRTISLNYENLATKSTQFNLSIDLGEYGVHDLDLEQTYLFSDSYVARRAEKNNDNSKLPLTFKGTIQGQPDTRVSLTTNDNFLSGFIDTGEDVIFFEPYKNFDTEADENELIIYYQKDVIDQGHACTANHTDQQTAHIASQNDQFKSAVTGCYEVEMVLVADYGMYQKHGDNTLNHITAVLNNVRDNYDNEFNDPITFECVDDYIATEEDMDLWTSTANADTLLSEFRDSVFTDVTYDLASLWVTRDIWGIDADTMNFNVAGIAYRPGVCSASRYNLIEDHSSTAANLRSTFAHEIGHNFSATHDPAGSSTIMAPSSNGSSTWSTQSQNQINAFYPGAACLCISGDTVDMAFISCGSSSLNGNILTVSDDAQVQNVGTVATGINIKTRWYLSTNSTIDLDDYDIATQIFEPYNPGSFSSHGFSVDLTTTGVPPGNYYLGAITDYDNAVTEFSEENNTCILSSSADITVAATPPDLQISSCSGLSSNNIVFFNNVRVENLGNSTAGASTLGIYLSTDNVINTNDCRVATANVSALNGGTTSAPLNLNFNTTTVIGVPGGNYYVGLVADADNNVTESNENNNSNCISSSPFVTIVGVECVTVPEPPEITNIQIYTDCDNGNIGFQLTLGNLDPANKYDVFYTTDLTSNVWQPAAPSGITISGSTAIWTDCGDNDRNTEDNLFYRVEATCDTDSDGLTDAYETLSTGTNPYETDSDTDGIPDSVEDSDCDGFTNLDEYTDPFMGAASNCDNSCRYTDSLALIAFYNSTAGANWINTWDLSQSIDTWYGIQLNEDGCVSCIDMDGVPNCVEQPGNLGNNLSGNIPVEIGNLSALTSLVLSHNQLSGGLPSELGNLSELTYLYLDDNQLSGSIPAELGNLNNLLRLHMRINQLSGNIPAEMGNLSSLQNLSLYDNQLSGNIPPELGNLNNLRSLWLNQNQLSGNIPVELGNLGNLQYLILSNNQFTDSIPSTFGNLSNLRHLTLFNNQLSGSIPSGLGNLSNLERLWLSDNELSGCYDNNLTNLCSQLSATFNTNYFISNGNNFDANWEDFCNNGTGTCPTCQDTDLLALLALYNATDGANWTNTWDLSQPIDTWYGVQLDENGCVSCIDMDGNVNCDDDYVYDGNNLSGYIPAEIGQLSSLTYLNLEFNELSGNIPTEIGQLNNLTHLIINNTQLSGNIPAEIGNLNNLELLSLISNQLSGNIPSELGDLNNLEVLNLINNQLSGSIPPELGNLNNLTKLYLFYNQLNGSIPPELGKLNNLQDLILFDNQLSGAIPPEIGNLSNVISLWLSNNQLSGNIPSELSNLGNLVSLNLSYNQLSGNIPLELADLANLENLFLRNNQLSGCYDNNLASLCSQLEPTQNTNYSISYGNNFDANWEDFCNNGAGTCPIPCGYTDSLALLALYNATDGANWTNTWDLSQPMGSWYGVSLNGYGCVSFLSLSDNQLSGSLPSEIDNLSSLMTLSLNNNQLSGSLPPEIGNLSNLITLSLSGNQLSGNIPSELGNLSNLIQLYLHENQLNGSIPPELGNLSSLVNLWLSQNQLSGNIPPEIGNLGDVDLLFLHENQLSGHIPPELGNLIKLKYLSLSYNQLTGSIPPDLGNLNRLTYLGLHNNQLTDSIPPELSNLNNLVTLYLSNNQLIGNIPYEFANLTSLSSLYLRGNNMSGCFDPTLSALCGQLNTVNVDSGNDFTISWADFCNGISCNNKITQNQEIDIHNYPNPFTEHTTIEYTLPQDSPVTLIVYDTVGKQIAILYDNETKTKGTHTTVFEGDNYPAGMYYYTIQAGEYISTQKMILTK